MEPKGPLLSPLEYATCQLPKPDQSIHLLPSSFLKTLLNIILASTDRPSKFSFSLRFPHKNPLLIHPLPQSGTLQAYLIFWCVFVSRSTDRAADIIATVTGIQTEADHTGPSTDWRPSDRLQEGSPAEQDSSVHVDNPGTELSLISAAAFTTTAEHIWGLFSIATATLTGIPQQGQAPDIRRAFWRFQRHCVRREG